VEENIRGSVRAKDGTFWMQSNRQFPTDGRQPRSFDRLLDIVHRYDKLLPYTASPSIEVALAAIREARKHLDEIEYEAVAVARGGHWSWRDIGASLGLSGSGAYRRFARPREEKTYSPMWKWEPEPELEDLF
jgi:hypothetical protein